MKYIFACVCLIATSLALGQTQRIVFKLPDFYPEGTAYSSRTNKFYVGSVKTGTICTVDRRGSATVFYRDSTLKSSFGMKVDSVRNCLWVCTGDPNYSAYSDASTFRKKIRIIGIDLSTGKKTRDFDLSALKQGNHFPNDLTLDNRGNLYITDSYSPVIYRIDSSEKASVWSESQLFSGLDIGLNGIAWHPAGFLLAVNNGNGSLLKISAVDPNKITEVRTGTFFPGADGLLIDGAGELVLVQNKGVNKIFKLQSSDNWITATVTAATAAEDRFQQPSTCVLQEGKVYVVNSKLNELQDPGISPSNEFSLQLASFKPVR